jgi:septum formation protein
MEVPVSALVLGSASPRRRELMQLLGVPFVVESADVDEAPRAGEAPDAYLERITMDKLEAVRAASRARAVGFLVADTVVVGPSVGASVILGKPRDAAGGEAMLAQLSGATHEVKTRFALGARERGVLHAETVTTRVTFRTISQDEIARYVATGEGQDKAGSYAVQGRGAAFVSRIEGSYTGVVGLPLCEVLVALRAVGWA